MVQDSTGGASRADYQLAARASRTGQGHGDAGFNQAKVFGLDGLVA